MQRVTEGQKLSLQTILLIVPPPPTSEFSSIVMPLPNVFSSTTNFVVYFNNTTLRVEATANSVTVKYLSLLRANSTCLNQVFHPAVINQTDHFLFSPLSIPTTFPYSITRTGKTSTKSVREMVSILQLPLFKHFPQRK